MTNEEITTIAKIMLTADSWCSSCSRSLIDELETAFPEHGAAIKAVFEQREDLENRFRAARSAWDYPAQPEPRVWLV